MKGALLISLKGKIFLDSRQVAAFYIQEPMARFFFHRHLAFTALFDVVYNFQGSNGRLTVSKYEHIPTCHPVILTMLCGDIYDHEFSLIYTVTVR